MNIRFSPGLRRLALLALLCGKPLHAQSPAPAPSALDPSLPPGIDAVRWQRLIAQLRSNGYSEDSLKACTGPLRTATGEGLPAHTLMLRLEEGAAKGIAPELLRGSLEQRRERLQTAAGLLQRSGYGSGAGHTEDLLNSVTLALESGIGPDAMQKVLVRGGGVQMERMRSIFEAGETLRLSGLDEATVGDMMLDFAERNLRRMEILRASRFVVQQHQNRVEGARIRQQLWGGQGGGWRGGRGDSSAPGGGYGAGALREPAPARSGGTEGTNGADGAGSANSNGRGPGNGGPNNKQQNR